jgi:hypothetical protein
LRDAEFIVYRIGRAQVSHAYSGINSQQPLIRITTAGYTNKKLIQKKDCPLQEGIFIFGL